jgi:FtsP/CotA-like multicopper oxidase with cupredoxin domain
LHGNPEIKIYENNLTLGIVVVVVIIGNRLLQRLDVGNKVLATTDITGLAEAKPSEMVELKNGDTYNLTASIVQKTIGNSGVKMLAYNDTGHATKSQGAEVTLNFTNNTDVDTTIHSHGYDLRINLMACLM